MGTRYVLKRTKDRQHTTVCGNKAFAEISEVTIQWWPGNQRWL